MTRKKRHLTSFKLYLAPVITLIVNKLMGKFMGHLKILEMMVQPFRVEQSPKRAREFRQGRYEVGLNSKSIYVTFGQTPERR